MNFILQLFVHSENRGLGVLLAFQDTLDHEVQFSIADPDGHYVVASVKSDGECFTIVNVLKLRIKRAKFCQK